jgi:hypothetical protein
MPANWSSFITNVSNKLSGQSIEGSYDPQGRDVDDFATFLAEQYVLAVDGKAQTPFGNLHQKGNTQLLTDAFAKAFKLMEEERSPTLEEKERDPKYEDLKEPIPSVNIDEYLDKFALEFLEWSKKNGASIPDFTFSQMFDTFPKYPKDENELIDKLSDTIISRFDGSSGYVIWLNSLSGDLGGKVLARINEKGKNILKKDLVKGDEVVATVSNDYYDFYNNFGKNPLNKRDIVGTISSIRTNLELRTGELLGLNIKKYAIRVKGTEEAVDADEGSVLRLIKPTDFPQYKSEFLTRKIFQENHYNDPQRIPSIYTEDFILSFTYAKGIDDSSLKYNYDYSAVRDKRERYAAEFKRNIDLKTKLVNEIADEYRNQEDINKPEEGTDDPYEIMAGGVLAYWASTLQQPFSSTPAVPPCVITAPLGGFYVPIYYGGRKRLADYLRRAFNTGKIFKTVPEKKISATAVSAALAFSFAANLLEFKLIYNGGIPTPAGPVPMIGFVPIVF